MEDTVYAVPLPNIYDKGSGYFCLGRINVPTNRGMRFRVDSLVEQLIASEWNNDLSYEIPANVVDFEDWAKKSISDPMLWRKLELQKHLLGSIDRIVDKTFNEVGS